MTPRLPASPDELRGLRARRYVRVSSEEQGWKYGPDGQHLTVDEAVARLGLVESGPAFVDEQSAWHRSDTRPALQAIVAAAAAGELDVVVVPYFSRWSRDTEVALRLRRELHAAGVVLVFADEWFVSSDEDSFDRYLDEAVAAHKYSNRLSRTVKRTLAAKFVRFGDQAGTAGLGFVRTPQPEARLAIDPETMPRVVRLFERYAEGDVSYRELALLEGIPEGHLRALLTNPLYNGWAVRNRRTASEARVAAPWRDDPPVTDELWARVADVRANRLRNAGGHGQVRSHLLSRLMVCTCGRGLAGDTVSVPGRVRFRRYRHEDCDRWTQGSHKAEVFEAPIAAQLASIRVDRKARERIQALAGNPPPTSPDLRRGQLESELRRRAADHAARRLTTEAYLAEHARITAAIDALVPTPTPGLGDVDEIIRRIEAIATTWEKASAEARAQLVRTIYRRITVEDSTIVSVELTPGAMQMGLPAVMAERVSVVVLARPARLARTSPITTRWVWVPIEGRDAWLRWLRSA